MPWIEELQENKLQHIYIHKEQIMMHPNTICINQSWVQQQRIKEVVLIYLFFHLNSTNFATAQRYNAWRTHQGTAGRDPDPPSPQPPKTAVADRYIYRSGSQVDGQEEEEVNQTPRMISRRWGRIAERRLGRRGGPRAYGRRTGCSWSARWGTWARRRPREPHLPRTSGHMVVFLILCVPKQLVLKCK